MNKKTIKTLSVGLLAVFGLLSFSGCSSAVDNSEAINGLSQQIEELQEEINNLQQDINNLTSQNQEMQQEIDNFNQEQLFVNDIIKTEYLREEIWQKYVKARSNYLTNANGVRNNLIIKVEFVEEQEHEHEISFYKRSNGEYSILKKFDNNIEFCYEDGEIAYTYSEEIIDDQTVRRRIPGFYNGLNNIDYSMFFGMEEYHWLHYGFYRGSSLQTLSKDTITSVEILPNGNFKITFNSTVFFEQSNYMSDDKERLSQSCLITTKEFSADGKILSEKSSLYNDLYDAEIVFNTTFKYGEVDVAELTDYIAIANQTEFEKYY